VWSIPLSPSNSASSGLAARDSLAMLGKLLGHADVKTTARYAHLADDPVKQAASRISNTIAAEMDRGTKS
jgi:integrase